MVRLRRVDLASELGAARREVQHRKRTLAAARRKRHRAVAKIDALPGEVDRLHNKG